MTKTGHTFSGWNTAANGSGTSYAAAATFNMPANNVTLFAQWTINTHTVTYDGNTNDGGTARVDGSSPYNYNTMVIVAGPGTLTKTGSTFAGWNTAANGSGTAYGPAATFNITADTTLYAQWTVNPTPTPTPTPDPTPTPTPDPTPTPEPTASPTPLPCVESVIAFQDFENPTTSTLPFSNTIATYVTESNNSGVTDSPASSPYFTSSSRGMVDSRR